MHIKRIIKHLTTAPRALAQIFPQEVLQKITQAISQGEKHHSGQVRFAVEHALGLQALAQKKHARERALEVFSNLRIWDTEHNNGVLIYLLLADKDVEIIADRGISVRVSDEMWQTICKKMEAAFSSGFFMEGVLQGIIDVNQLLAAHFPAAAGQTVNELSDQPVVL